MTNRFTKSWVAVAGLALVASASGLAVAADNPDDWYDGDNATVADANKTSVALTLYDATGAPITSGTTTTPIAAYVGAAGDVRVADSFASLFVHLPQKGTAPGAWPGVQATGTDRFTGSGAVVAPNAAVGAGKPFVRADRAGAYTLADVQAAFPNPETASPSFVGVYELRLRTSSASQGVSDQYAATYLKVTGATWTVTTAPVLGGGGETEPEPEPVATSVAVAWPARLTYGTAASVAVSVVPASGTAKPTGSVRLVTGATTLGTATLTPSGTATLSVPRTALAPGARSLKVTYATSSATAFRGSESAAKAFAVAKAAPGKPAFKVTKAPSAKKAGAATVTVPTAAGLAKATGKVQVTLTKGRTTKKVAGTVAGGAAKVTIPKLPKGSWTVTVLYQGNAYYLTSTKAFRLTSKAK